jgi:outer membrane autotransporter protein
MTSISVASSRVRRAGWTFAGAGFAVMLSASSAAFAGCSGTGALAVNGPQGVTPFLPFASGGAVSALIASINTANTAFLTQSTAFVSAPPNPAPNQEGGGVWARAIGGEITTKNTTTTSNVQALGVQVPGTITCDNENRLTFAGAQVGTDIANLNVSGWNFHVGASVGYLGAKSRDVSSPGPLNPGGGTFQDTLQVPFFALYAAATKGGFFIDGQIRRDFYQNSLNDPLVSGLFDQKLDARGLAFSGNVGYNMPLQNNWFIEPSAGIVVSKVKVDPLNVTGTGLAAVIAGGAVGTFPGQLRISDINSTLARLSLRGGTTIASGNMIWQPFVTLSVYHEFQGAISSSFDGLAVTQFTGVPGLPSGLISTSNIGTYGQIGVGVSGQIVNTGWLGYVRADYRDGDNLHGYSVNGGIRYQFTPDILSPKPMYAKAPVLKAPAAFVQPYNWTGFFVGGSVGVLNGQVDMNYLAPPVAAGFTANPRFAGALGGIQAGYDYQTGKWVFGVEANINATNAHGARPCQVFIVVNCEDQKDWIGTATARAGYAFWNRALVYGRAGVAFTNTTIRSVCNGNGVIPIGCPATDSQSRAGWTVGLGSEFALTQNWTVRGETNYYDLGTNTYNLQQIPPAPALVVDVREKGFISTVGLNYRFAPGVVVAKY